MIQVNTIGTKEASEILGISFPHVHDLIREHKITVIGRFGRNLVLDRYQVLVLKRDREIEKLRRNDARLK